MLQRMQVRHNIYLDKFNIGRVSGIIKRLCKKYSLTVFFQVMGRSGHIVSSILLIIKYFAGLG